MGIFLERSTLIVVPYNMNPEEKLECCITMDSMVQVNRQNIRYVAKKAPDPSREETIAN